MFSNFEPAFGPNRQRNVWICQYCGHAVHALQWAEANRIRVPQDLAIISLEDNPEMSHYGISCCLAAPEREGYLMAHVLIGDIPVGRSTKGYVRVDAHMRERCTTP